MADLVSRVALLLRRVLRQPPGGTISSPPPGDGDTITVVPSPDHMIYRRTGASAALELDRLLEGEDL